MALGAVSTVGDIATVCTLLLVQPVVPLQSTVCASRKKKYTVHPMNCAEDPDPSLKYLHVRVMCSRYKPHTYLEVEEPAGDR